LEGWDSAEVSMPLKCVGNASLEEVEACTIGVTSTSLGVDRTTVRLLTACWDSVKLSYLIQKAKGCLIILRLRFYNNLASFLGTVFWFSM
jgi:hypothetical protein